MGQRGGVFDGSLVRGVDWDIRIEIFIEVSVMIQIIQKEGVGREEGIEYMILILIGRGEGFRRIVVRKLE